MALATPVIVATYAEIALKGRNRQMFLRKLLNNMRRALAGEPVTDILHVESRIIVRLEDPESAAQVAAVLRRIFGLQWVSPAVPVPRSEVDAELAADRDAGREPGLARIGTVARELAAADRQGALHFKVDTRRSDRSFPLTSPEISRIVGSAVGQELRLPARMQNPDLQVNVLVLKDDVLVFTAKEAAYGGLPAGASGRVMVLLSGGIDSPVAAWLMMRRGVRPEFVHFYSGRSAEEAEAEKIEQLVEILGRFSPVPLNLWLVPVVSYETRAIGVITDSHDMVMFRRFMFLTAARLAYRQNCRALVTGDSLGQVASQTLANLAAIAPDVTLPVLRPLVGMDKMEITAWSQEVGLFETSVLPYRDCCSIRSPRPILKARAQDLLHWSEQMKMDDAVHEALHGAVKVVVPEQD
jgi:thiamine biosynthesis protein ThiI